jgi:hypothetical protein
VVSAATLADRAELPLPRLMEQQGDLPPADSSWKSFPCPFCTKKGASVRERKGQVDFGFA